jgi:hypothetical protein
LQKSIRGASAVRGEEEEEIEKVSVFALAFAVARLKGLVLFVLFFLTFFFLTIAFSHSS